MSRRWLLVLLPCLWMAAGIGAADAAGRGDAPRSARVSQAELQEVEAQDVEALVEAKVQQAKRERRKAREREARERFRTLSLVRGGIALAGFSVFAWGVWLRRKGRDEVLRALRLGLLVTLAIASFAAYYNFFQTKHPGGFKGADVFHYYMGSKYFEEIGHFDLYPCTLAALVEQGLQDPSRIPKVRDQRSLRIEPREATLAAMRTCPERFEPERWQEFRADVAFFRQRVLGGSWVHLLEDHGYNPTPVWSFVGGLFSKAVPADPESFPALIAVDRVLAVAMALLIAWAFGLEAACLAALVWGASPLWDYSWIGDAFLRNAWAFCAVAGLCLLERGRHLSSGALLASAALLRLFPGVFLAGFLAAVARRWKREGVPKAAKQVAVGALVAGVVLLVGGAVGTGRGPVAYLEFQQKMSGVVGQAGVNKLGASALATELVHRATTREVTRPDGRTVKVREYAPIRTGAVVTARSSHHAGIGIGMKVPSAGCKSPCSSPATINQNGPCRSGGAHTSTTSPLTSRRWTTRPSSSACSVTDAPSTIASRSPLNATCRGSRSES